MRRLIAAAALSVALFVPATGALAAPITCPAGQDAVKDAPDVWHCENRGDSGNPSTEDPKNPNR